MSKSNGVNCQGQGVLDIEFPTDPKFDFLPDVRVKGPSAFLSVQEGCDKFCTFCVVPYTRGAEYSRDVVDVVTEARHMAEHGVREITLLGQNVNAYRGQRAPGRGGSAGLRELIGELANVRRPEPDSLYNIPSGRYGRKADSSPSRCR